MSKQRPDDPDLPEDAPEGISPGGTARDDVAGDRTAPDGIPAVLFGAAYYHEYQPSERLAADLDLMAEAGFTVIRVGESVWSTWEPADGEFDLEWLAPVLDGAAERGIHVILGTPTYAAPPWLQHKHPEIAAHRADGTPVPWGARQEIDFTSPVFRGYAERVVRRIVSRYAAHPAVIGYQVDNEPGLLLMHNPAILAGFAEHLREQYGTVEELNRRWGLTYWSHRLSDWSQLWRPEGNTTPSYDLAWRRYQAALTTDFIRWQAGIVRELRRPGQFVMTCLAYNRAATDDVALTGALDVAAGNPYLAVQDELALPDAGRRYDSTWITQGTWQLYLSADRMCGSRRERFLVTETGASSIGGPFFNYPPYDGQLRQVAWTLVSRGARMVEYWHWHTLHYGCETYWGGVIGHGLEPGRIYAEARSIGRELAAAGPALRDLRPEADVTFLRSLDSSWAMQHQPPLGTGPGGFGPDRRSYDRIFGAFYQGFFDAGCQAEVISVPQFAGPAADLARRHPVLVAPGLYIAGDETLDLLDGYARAGGHLILTFRSGYADQEARARAEVAPGRLREAAGLHYLEYSNLRSAVPVTAAPGGPLDLGAGARATEWADGLIVDDAEALAWYEHPHFGRWPAAATRVHGAGRVTYVGTLPDHGFAVALARFALAVSGSRAGGDGPGPRPDGLPGGEGTIAGRDGWGELPETVRVTSAVNGSGERIWFVHHWSWGEASVSAPTALTDVLGGEDVEAGQPVTLRDWDVRVFRQARRFDGRRS